MDTLTCPHPYFAGLNNTQTYRLYLNALKRMERGQGYQPYGWDWVTLRLTRPGWYDALKLICRAHNWALAEYRKLNPSSP